MRHASATLILAASLLLPGCERAETPTPVESAATGAPLASADWSAWRDRFIEDYLVAHPAFAVNQGRHEFDGRLPDWSREGIAKEIARLHAARKEALALEAGLDERERFERDYLVARIDRDLFWLEVAEAPFTNPAFYLDWTSDNLDPSPYLTREYAPLEQRFRAYTAYLRAVPQAAAQIRANLRMPMAATLVERGISAFGGFAQFFEKEGGAVFAAVRDEEARREYEAANREAIRAMRELAAWLESERKRADQSFALGPEKFARMLLMTEQVDTPLAELERIGRADYERNLAALKGACATFTPGASIVQCFAKMASRKPKGGPVQAARDQLPSLKAFVLENEVVSVPGEEQARVEESPPYNRANSAYIDIPGPYEKGLPATYYIAPPDPSWSPAEQREYIPGERDLLFTTVHEVWPGHFLNFLHAKRSESIIGRLFVGYAYSEGWAHYGEELMWEKGLGKGDPETHIGMLSNALLRNVRYLCAIGLHTRGMSVGECERMFREQGFQDAGTARQQAARGTYDPAYLNYTMGKLMIRKLRADWSQRRGREAAWRDFHDRLLSFGGPPVPMVRRAMLGPGGGALF